MNLAPSRWSNGIWLRKVGKRRGELQQLSWRPATKPTLPASRARSASTDNSCDAPIALNQLFARDPSGKHLARQRSSSRRRLLFLASWAVLTKLPFCSRLVNGPAEKR